METIDEVTQIWCKCEAKDCREVTYIIQAQVEFEEGVGSKLKITIQPPLNNISYDVLDFDNSRLPYRMVYDWFSEHIKEVSCVQSFKTLESNEEIKKLLL